MIRLLIADDHPIFVRGLTRFFEEESEEFKVVATAPDGKEAWERLQDCEIDVAILDLLMPEPNGIELTERTTKAGLAKVILLTGSDQPHTVYQAMAAGASGYLLKTADWRDLADAVRQVMAGETVISPEVMGTLATAIRKQPGRLTPREREVLTLLSSGMLVPEIAKKLMLSPETIKGYLKHVFEKLEVRGQAEAVAEAIRRGLIE